MNGTISPRILATAVGPVDFNSAWKGGEEGGSTADVTITEGLGAGVGPALGWIEDVEVTNEETFPSRQLNHTAAAARSRRRSSWREPSGW